MFATMVLGTAIFQADCSTVFTFIPVKSSDSSGGIGNRLGNSFGTTTYIVSSPNYLKDDK